MLPGEKQVCYAAPLITFFDCDFFKFQEPITDFCLPIVSLKDWFPVMNIRYKRRDIAGIIETLAQKSNPSSEFTFPDIKLIPDDGYVQREDEDDEEDHRHFLGVDGVRSLTLTLSSASTSQGGGGQRSCDIKVVKTFVPRLTKKVTCRRLTAS